MLLFMTCLARTFDKDAMQKTPREHPAGVRCVYGDYSAVPIMAWASWE